MFTFSRVLRHPGAPDAPYRITTTIASDDSLDVPAGEADTFHVGMYAPLDEPLPQQPSIEVTQPDPAAPSIVKKRIGTAPAPELPEWYLERLGVDLRSAATDCIPATATAAAAERDFPPHLDAAAAGSDEDIALLHRPAPLPASASSNSTGRQAESVAEEPQRAEQGEKPSEAFDDEGPQALVTAAHKGKESKEKKEKKEMKPKKSVISDQQSGELNSPADDQARHVDEAAAKGVSWERVIATRPVRFEAAQSDEQSKVAKVSLCATLLYYVWCESLT
jgi:hypothetical protein